MPKRSGPSVDKRRRNLVYFVIISVEGRQLFFDFSAILQVNLQDIVHKTGRACVPQSEHAINQSSEQAKGIRIEHSDHPWMLCFVIETRGHRGSLR
jgi:hypothetical protein